MKLKTKIYLYLGVLFVIVFVVNIFIPYLIVFKQDENAGHSFINYYNEHTKLFNRNRKKLLDEIIENIDQQMTTLLTLISEGKELTKEISNGLPGAIALSKYAPFLGLIQITSQDHTVAYLPGEIDLYSVEVNSKGEFRFNGITYDTKPLKENYYTFSMISGIANESNAIPLDTAPKEMIDLLLTMPATSEGIIQIKKDGLASLLFKDQVIKYQKVANPKGIIAANQMLNHAYLTKSHLIDGSELTIGWAIDLLIEQLSLSQWSDTRTLTKANNQFFFIDKNNQVIPLKSFSLSTDNSKIEINNVTYSFEKFVSLDDSNLIFYDLRSINAPESLRNRAWTVAAKAAKNISWQLFIVLLVILCFVIIFISQVVLRAVIKPIVKLAEATKVVALGHYNEVDLPKVANRKDEIAELTNSFENMVLGLQEKEKIRGVLNKVVSKKVAEEILKSEIHLGGEDRNITILFADIRGFTTMTEHLDPQETILLLNTYMTHITHIIDEEGGVIDKYIGDCVMAIFNAPTNCPDHSVRAISAALRILEEIKRINQERNTHVEMGIGINSGIAVAGNMGAEDRLNYTVLGANVNLASRLCSKARPSSILISEQTSAAPHVQELFDIKSIEPVELKGFTDPVSIFEVIGKKQSS